MQLENKVRSIKGIRDQEPENDHERDQGQVNQYHGSGA
jgi:hypothetical protein